MLTSEMVAVFSDDKITGTTIAHQVNSGGDTFLYHEVLFSFGLNRPKVTLEGWELKSLRTVLLQVMDDLEKRDRELDDEVSLSTPNR